MDKIGDVVFCIECGRRLRGEKSKERGIGPGCAKKIGVDPVKIKPNQGNGPIVEISLVVCDDDFGPMILKGKSAIVVAEHPKSKMPVIDHLGMIVESVALWMQGRGYFSTKNDFVTYLHTNQGKWFNLSIVRDEYYDYDWEIEPLVEGVIENPVIKFYESRKANER